MSKQYTNPLILSTTEVTEHLAIFFQKKVSKIFLTTTYIFFSSLAQLRLLFNELCV